LIIDHRKFEFTFQLIRNGKIPEKLIGSTCLATDKPENPSK
jgi:hypothetical protein